MTGPLILPALHQGSLEQAAALLRAGQLVAFPTDTVYGVGAIYNCPEGVERIYHAKGRPEEKGIPILLASDQDLLTVVSGISAGAARLAAAFWPGPLTLVLPKSPAVISSVSQTASVAVRIPDHPLTRALIAAVGLPLAVTSANRSGEPATKDPAEVSATLGDGITALLDGGLAPGGVPSTIVDCSIDPPRILRLGPISAEQVLACYHDHRD